MKYLPKFRNDQDEMEIHKERGLKELSKLRKVRMICESVVYPKKSKIMFIQTEGGLMVA